MTDLKVDLGERDYSFAYAGFYIRLVAFIIDMLVAGAIYTIVKIFLPLDMDRQILYFSLGEIIKTILTLAYFSLMTYFTNGRTLGKMILGLRTVSLTSDKLSLGQVLLRELAGRYVSNKFTILYIIVGLTPKKQGLFDVLLDTTVVKEDIYNHLYKN
ncbi:RDD family protein [uncultured Anaerococcus sp.]|uniref:RDD family protein n=1 Tax=uncultured Anaerococcus sp. TaxID=293428 RepID=UPI0026329AD5|nr:RDD family protein [uncultured Anaerococcus sp.]